MGHLAGAYIGSGKGDREHIGGALYDLGVNDRDSALRRLYRAKAALEDAIGRVQVEKYGDVGNRPHGGLQ